MSLAAHGLSMIRLVTWVAVTTCAVPIQLVCLALGPRQAAWFPPHYHRLVLRLFGITVTVRGEEVRSGPALVVANHVSYLDAIVLGSLHPASVIAKQELLKWPVFGQLARLQRCVFIERKRRQAAGDQRDALAKRLEQHEILILFPEGTSSDGNRVVPFKSSLFGAAETRPGGQAVTVQPVSIAYVRLNGMPIGRDLRSRYAWYGDMVLAGHLWTLAGLGMTEVVVQFHAPVTIDQFGNRKIMAGYCHRIIAAGLEAANAGRPLPMPVPSEAAGAADALLVPA